MSEMLDTDIGTELFNGVDMILVASSGVSLAVAEIANVVDNDLVKKVAMAVSATLFSAAIARQWLLGRPSPIPDEPPSFYET